MHRFVARIGSIDSWHGRVEDLLHWLHGNKVDEGIVHSGDEGARKLASFNNSSRELISGNLSSTRNTFGADEFDAFFNLLKVLLASSLVAFKILLVELFLLLELGLNVCCVALIYGCGALESLVDLKIYLFRCIHGVERIQRFVGIDQATIQKHYRRYFQGKNTSRTWTSTALRTSVPLS